MALPRMLVSEDDPPSKRAILTAALTLFARDGVEETNIRSIAAEAGYTNPALFKFFAGKEALALYLFERCYAHCLAALRGALSRTATFSANLHAVVRDFVALVERDPDVFFFVNDNLRRYWPHASAATRRHSMIGEFRTLVEQGRREGCVTRDVSIELQITAITGFFSQLARLHHFGEFDGDLRAQRDDIESMIVKLLA